MSVTTLDKSSVSHRGRSGRVLLRRLIVVASDWAALFGAALGTRFVLDANDLTPKRLTLFGVTFWLWMVAGRLYNSRLVTNRREELARVGRSGVRALLVVAATTPLFRSDVRLRSLALLLACSVVAVAWEREIFRAWFTRRRRSGRNLWATVLVADSEGERQLSEAIHANHSTPHTISAHVDPTKAEGGEALLTEVLAEARHVQARGVMLVESCLDTKSANFLVRGLLEADIYVDLVSALSDISTDRLATRNLGPSIATWISPRPRHGWRARAKRAFDMVVTSSVLIFAAPVMIVIAALVKFTSDGPILFSQERIGRNGEPFQMLKFRSMVVNAADLLPELSSENEGAGPLFKMEKDPRVTRVGHFLRRTSLDELPQLFNVLKKEMSLVGPRPALRSEMAAWPPDLYSRLSVQPGITGMWQVSGRSSTSFDEYTRLDLYYVHNWSLVEDLTILLKTVPSVLKGDGAC